MVFFEGYYIYYLFRNDLLTITEKKLIIRYPFKTKKEISLEGFSDFFMKGNSQIRALFGVRIDAGDEVKLCDLMFEVFDAVLIEDINTHLNRENNTQK